MLHDRVGRLTVRRINADGTVGTTVFNGHTGRNGPQALTTYTIAEQPYFFALQ